MRARANISAERGASIIETAVSVALVGMIAIVAVRSLGVGLRGSVNNLTHTLNPSLLEAPQITLDAPPLEMITTTGSFNSKPAIIPNNPPPKEAKPSGLSGGGPRIR